jgi:hypothetical protein
MELHSLPVDCDIGGIFEGMLWMVEKDAPSLRLNNLLLEKSPATTPYRR